MAEILFVEDDEKIRDIFARFLMSKGHQVQTASNGQEAIDLVKQKKMDVIVMDVKMPKLDGLSAFHEIRAVSPTLPVVLMTGYHIQGELAHLLNTGQVRCLHKPVLTTDLEEMVNQSLVAGGSAGALAPKEPSASSVNNQPQGGEAR